MGVGIIYGQHYKYYHQIAAVYGQNKHAHANLELRYSAGAVLSPSFSPKIVANAAMFVCDAAIVMAFQVFKVFKF